MFVIFGGARNRPDLVETLRVQQLLDAIANGKPALVSLTLDLVNASHLARERFAPGEVVEFRLPDHSSPPSLFYYCCAPAREAIFAPAGWQRYRPRLRPMRRRRRQGPASGVRRPCGCASRHTSPTTTRSSPRHRSGTAATTAARRSH